jgi:hypothetical protein
MAAGGGAVVNVLLSCGLDEGTGGVQVVLRNLARGRFSSRSAFSLALLRLLDENRLQTAVLSPLLEGNC